MRAVFAWELGAGLGHVARQGALAHALSARGWAVVHALRDLQCTVEGAAWIHGECLQAPWLARAPAVPAGVPASYAGVLTEAGYGNPDTLAALVRAWQGLMAGARADVLVADHAPTAMLAARIAGLPVVHVGDGFTVPPPEGAYFGDDLRRERARLAENEAHVLGCINAVRARHGAEAWDSLYALWKADLTILATYPELDHYRGVVRDIPYEGWLEPEVADPGGWRQAVRPRVLAYLKPGSRQFAPALDLFERLRWNVRVYAGGLKRASPDPVWIEVSDAPLPTGAVRDCDVVVCPGGHGLTCAALLAGKPVLMLPEFTEQMLTARNVEALGAGLWVHPEADARALKRAMNRLVEDPALREAAGGFAERYAAQRRRATVRLAELAERVHALVTAKSRA